MEDPTPPAERDIRLQTYCLLTLTILAVGVALWLLRPVLVPFMLALFFVIGLSPLLDLIQRRLNATRPAAIGVTFILGVVLVVVFSFMLISTIETVQNKRTIYRNGVIQMIESVAPTLEWIGVDVPPKAEEAFDKTKKFIGDQMSSVMLWVGTALIDLLINLGVVLIFMFFLLAGASSEARPTTGLWVEIEEKIRGYVVTKTIISVFTGLAFGLVLGIMGVDMAPQLGVLAFLLNYVPNVGPVIASLLPVPLVLFLMPDASPLYKTLTIGAGCAVQLISGNVIEPKVMGNSFELHPIVILLSLILWGIIWGPVGVLLAVPMTAAVKVLLDKLDRTRPIAALLAGHLEPLEQAIDREAMA